MFNLQKLLLIFSCINISWIFLCMVDSILNWWYSVNEVQTVSCLLQHSVGTQIYLNYLRPTFIMLTMDKGALTTRHIFPRIEQVNENAAAGSNAYRCAFLDRIRKINRSFTILDFGKVSTCSKCGWQVPNFTAAS